jgi:Uri superfamily endonuclease
MIGSYVLLIELKELTSIQIGKLGHIDFPASWYVYVGSALNGIEHRIDRHFSQKKKQHWHIDYFLNYSHLHQAYCKENPKREECNIAHLFAKKFQLIPSFGSSDCNCKSHLFYGDKQDLIKTIWLAEMTLLNR